MKDYLINVFYSEKDKCYVADIPDLKYCSALGATPERAVREVSRAKKAWLATAKKKGSESQSLAGAPSVIQAIRCD